MQKIIKLDVRYSSVKPSEERQRERAERLAEQFGGSVVEISSLTVGRNRSRGTIWDGPVTIRKEA